MNNIFNIGDLVYHKTPDSESGIITEISYYFSTKKYKYLVAISMVKSEWCEEIELSDTKVF